MQPEISLKKEGKGVFRYRLHAAETVLGSVSVIVEVMTCSTSRGTGKKELISITLFARRFRSRTWPPEIRSVLPGSTCGRSGREWRRS